MPLKNGKMTPQERTLVKEYAATGDKLQAGKAAGYAHPLIAANHALARPAVAAEVQRLQVERMTNVALPLAVQTIIDIMESKTAPANHRLLAAKLTLDNTIGRQDAGGGKEPHEMTAAELQASIDEARRRLADLSRPILEGEATTIDQAGDVFS